MSRGSARTIAPRIRISLYGENARCSGSNRARSAQRFLSMHAAVHKDVQRPRGSLFIAVRRSASTVWTRRGELPTLQLRTGCKLGLHYFFQMRNVRRQRWPPCSGAAAQPGSQHEAEGIGIASFFRLEFRMKRYENQRPYPEGSGV